jgi:uncharacterized membrane protein
MALWWIGNAIFILIVIPVVVVLLQRLLKAVADIGRHVDTIHSQAAGIVVALDDVKQLVPTSDAVKQVTAGLARYAKAVARIL